MCSKVAAILTSDGSECWHSRGDCGNGSDGRHGHPRVQSNNTHSAKSVGAIPLHLATTVGNDDIVPGALVPELQSQISLACNSIQLEIVRGVTPVDLAESLLRPDADPVTLAGQVGAAGKVEGGHLSGPSGVVLEAALGSFVSVLAADLGGLDLPALGSGGAHPVESKVVASVNSFQINWGIKLNVGEKSIKGGTLNLPKNCFPVMYDFVVVKPF